MELLRQLGPSIMVCIGAAVAVLLLMRETKRRFKVDRETKPFSRHGQLPRNTFTEEADEPPEMLRWQVELHELARDTKAELDSKMRALQAISLLADETAQRLETLIGRAERLGSRPPSDSDVEFPDGVEPKRSDIQCITPASGGRVYSLADQDKSAVEIAQETGLAIGDVEFLLALRS